MASPVEPTLRQQLEACAREHKEAVRREEEAENALRALKQEPMEDNPPATREEIETAEEEPRFKRPKWEVEAMKAKTADEIANCGNLECVWHVNGRNYGNHARYPDLERQLAEWAHGVLSDDYHGHLTQPALRAKAHALAMDLGVTSFACSRLWFSQFCARNLFTPCKLLTQPERSVVLRTADICNRCQKSLEDLDPHVPAVCGEGGLEVLDMSNRRESTQQGYVL